MTHYTRSAGSFGLAAGIGISAVCESSAVAAMEILPHSQVAARVALRTATASQARRSATQHRASRIALPSPILSAEEGAAFGARDRLLHTVRGNFRLEAYKLLFDPSTEICGAGRRRLARADRGCTRGLFFVQHDRSAGGCLRVLRAGSQGFRGWREVLACARLPLSTAGFAS